MYYYKNENGESITLSYYEEEYILKSITGLDSLDNEINTYKGVNMDGSIVSNMNVAEREVSVTGMYVYDNVLRKKLLRVFNPKLKGTLYCIDKDTEEEKYIECCIEATPIIKSNGYLQEFVVDFICPDPYLKSIINGEIISTWIGGWKFKFKLPFRFKQKGESKKNIYNEGHVETPVEIIFKGPALNPKITNLTTGEFVKVDKELTSDDTLYITTGFGNKKVEIERDGVRQNAFNYIDLDSTFFQLITGDNLIEYSTENQLEPQSVEIKYRNRYLGV